MSENDDLKERVQKFQTLSLPGQGMSMHMGTSYLVNDLWREVLRLREDGYRLTQKLAQAQTVVDAAKEWRKGREGKDFSESKITLIRAVDAYQREAKP